MISVGIEFIKEQRIKVKHPRYESIHVMLYHELGKGYYMSFTPCKGSSEFISEGLRGKVAKTYYPEDDLSEFLATVRFPQYVKDVIGKQFPLCKVVL